MADNSHLTDVSNPNMPDDTLKVLRGFSPRYKGGWNDDVSYEAVVVLRIGGAEVEFKGCESQGAEAFKAAAQAAIDSIFLSPHRSVTEDVPLSRGTPKNRLPPSTFPCDSYPNGLHSALRRDGSYARACIQSELPQRRVSGANLECVPPSSADRNGRPTNSRGLRSDAINRSQGEGKGSSNRLPSARPIATHDFSSPARQTSIVLLPTPQIPAAPYCSNAPSVYAHNMGNTPSEAQQNPPSTSPKAPRPQRKRKSRLLASHPAPTRTATAPREPDFATRAPTSHSAPLRTSHNAVRTPSKTTQPPSNQASTSIHRRVAHAQRESPFPSTKRKAPKHAPAPPLHQSTSFKPVQSRHGTPSKKIPASSAFSRANTVPRTSLPLPRPTRAIGNVRSGSSHQARAYSHVPLANLQRPPRAAPPQRNVNRRETSDPFGLVDSNVEGSGKGTRKRVRPRDRMERISLTDKRPANAKESRERPAPPGFGSHLADLPAPQRIPRDPAAPKEDSSSYDDLFKQVHSGKSKGPKVEPVMVDVSKLLIGRKRGADIVAGIDDEVQSKRRKDNGKASEVVTNERIINVENPWKVLNELADRKVMQWSTKPFIGGFAQDEEPLHGMKLTVEFRSKMTFAVKATASSLEEARNKAVVLAVNHKDMRPFVKKLLRKKRKQEEKMKESASPMVTRVPHNRKAKKHAVSSIDDIGVKFFFRIRNMDGNVFKLPSNYNTTLARTNDECEEWIDSMLNAKRQKVGVYFEASEIHGMLGAPTEVSCAVEKVIALATSRGALLCIQNASMELEWPPPAIADALKCGRYEMVALSPSLAMASDEFLNDLKDITKLLPAKMKNVPFKEIVAKMFHKEVGDLYEHSRLEIRARPAVKVAAITLALYSYLKKKRDDKNRHIPNGDGHGHNVGVVT